MKQTPEMTRIQEQMRPGRLTRDGFLGTDPRNLADILADDDARVARLGLTHEAVARRMAELRDAGAGGLGDLVDVAPHFEVKVDSVRGKLPSPFGDAGLVQKRNTTVRNSALDSEITYTDMNIHMIEAHGFYEGRGSPFRMDPGTLAEVLEMEPVPDAGDQE